MKRTSCALLLLLVTVLPIASSPLESLDTASLLFRIGFGINPFGDKVRFPVVLEMSVVLPSMVELGAGLTQTGEMLLVYGLGAFGLDPFIGDELYLPLKVRVGGGSMFQKWTWTAGISAGIGAVLLVEESAFSNPFLADVQGLVSAIWYFDRADGRKIDVFPEAAAGIFITDE